MTKRSKPVLVPAMPEQSRPVERRRWWHRFRREKPSTYQKCLAVHLHFARPTSALR